MRRGLGRAGLGQRGPRRAARRGRWRERRGGGGARGVGGARASACAGWGNWRRGRLGCERRGEHRNGGEWGHDWRESVGTGDAESA